MNLIASGWLLCVTSLSPAKREVKREVGKRGRGGQKNKTSAGGLVLGLVVFGGAGASPGAPKSLREARERGVSGAFWQLNLTVCQVKLVEFGLGHWSHTMPITKKIGRFDDTITHTLSRNI